MFSGLSRMRAGSPWRNTRRQPGVSRPFTYPVQYKKLLQPDTACPRSVQKLLPDTTCPLFRAKAAAEHGLSRSAQKLSQPDTACPRPVQKLLPDTTCPCSVQKLLPDTACPRPVPEATAARRTTPCNKPRTDRSFSSCEVRPARTDPA